MLMEYVHLKVDPVHISFSQMLIVILTVNVLNFLNIPCYN